MRDKDVETMLRLLAPHASVVVVTRASNPRSADPNDLAAVVRALRPSLPVEIAAGPAQALDAAWRHGPRIVVAGSIFLLGDILKAIGS